MIVRGVRGPIFSKSEVGGKSAAPQPGNRFVSFVRARGAGCEVEMQLKRRAPGFPFSLLPAGGFPFSLENTPFPPTSYPALAGLIGIYIYTDKAS